jgi:hypothetical protein
MTSAMLIVFGAAAIVVLGILRALFVSLLAGEVKAALAARLRQRVEAAALTLPYEVRDDVGNEWRAELEAFKERPIAALRFARGLRAAALDIAAQDALASRPSEETSSSQPATPSPSSDKQDSARWPSKPTDVEPKTAHLSTLLDGYIKLAKPFVHLGADVPATGPLQHATGEQLLAILDALGQPRTGALADRALAKVQSGFVLAVQRSLEGADLDDPEVRPILVQLTQRLADVDQKIRDMDEPIYAGFELTPSPPNGQNPY